MPVVLSARVGKPAQTEREKMETEQLQELLDMCARKMRRLHEWGEAHERAAGSWPRYEGEFDAFYEVARFTLSVAHAHGVELNTTRLDAALEIGDFL